MNSISEIWINSKETFDSKSLSQILSFAGDGKLKDNNTTSIEFRELLEQVPFELLKNFLKIVSSINLMIVVLHFKMLSTKLVRD